MEKIITIKYDGISPEEAYIYIIIHPNRIFLFVGQFALIPVLFPVGIYFVSTSFDYSNTKRFPEERHEILYAKMDGP